MSQALSVPTLSASDLHRMLAEGRFSLEDAVTDLLHHAQATEPELQAFAHLSPEVIGPQVERLLMLKHTGQPLPALYGVPVGVKDNIDTADYPTELGFEGAVGRTPSVDAWLVHRLRAAGALIWGKTRTAELAFLNPGPTTNPRVPGHTPGGSSSGSAAAVAAGLVPVAIGTQTNGSVIRPASFCGVFGFKPSRDLISNRGVLACSPSLDQVGVFARNIEDLARVSEVIIGGHETPSGALVFPMSLTEVALQEPPLTPKFMFAKTPFWDQVDPAAQVAFEALRDELTDCLTEIDLHPSVAHSVGWLKTVMDAEMTHNLQGFVDPLGDRASTPLKELMQRGRAVSAVDYLEAKRRCDQAAYGFDEFFDHIDAFVVPASLGPAPKGLGSTGNPLMSTIWTFAGLPCISLPLLQTESGHPIGVQLVGAKGQDARLLRTARWLMRRLTSE